MFLLVVCIIFVSVGALLYGFKIVKRPTVTLLEDEIIASGPFVDFASSAEKISAIRASVNSKAGCHLSVFLVGDPRGHEIPIAKGSRCIEYRDTLKLFCEKHNIEFVWPENVTRLCH